MYYLSHLLNNDNLKTFDWLKAGHKLPNNMFFFRYLQIRLAFQTQFPSVTPQLDSNSLMEVVKSSDPKKQISVLYTMLLLPSSSKLAYKPKLRWEGDVSAMEDEE